MLLPTKFQQLEMATPYAKWNKRLPLVWETVGPTQEGVAVDSANVWRAFRAGGVVQIHSPSGVVSQQPLEEGAEFIFAFDLNGRMYSGTTHGGKVTWRFWDSRIGDYSTITWEGWDAYATLDSVGPRNEPPVDVLVAYRLDGYLWVRYQRDRFEVPHKVGVYPPRAKLRTAGMSAQNRWVWRFDATLPKDFEWSTEDGS